MGLYAPDPPDPPDPQETSAAQTGTSISTAIANTMAGNVNQSMPGASLQYIRSGTYNFRDPYTGENYQIPQFTARTSLSPTGQKTFDQQELAKLGLATMANQQTQRIGEHLSKPFNPNPGAPKLTSNLGLQKNVRQQGVNLQDNIGGNGQYQNQVRRVEQALMGRLNPQIQQDREAMEASLANQGITLGGRAYSAAQDDMSRAANDARTGVLLAAGQEQSRLAGLDLARGQFRNDARLGEAGFNNQARMAAAQFGNNARTTQGQFGNAARGQYINEAYAQRNQPINEITALMSGSQVQMPNFQMNQPSQIPTTDVAGNIWNNWDARYKNWQGQSAQMGDIFGGIGSIFGAGFGMM